MKYVQLGLRIIEIKKRTYKVASYMNDEGVVEWGAVAICYRAIDGRFIMAMALYRYPDKLPVNDLNPKLISLPMQEAAHTLFKHSGHTGNSTLLHPRRELAAEMGA